MADERFTADSHAGCHRIHLARENFSYQQSMPAFDQVEPAGRGRRKVQVEAWSLRQPVANKCVL